MSKKGRFQVLYLYEFMLFTVSAGLTVISAQAGIRLLLTAFLTDLILDHAVQ
jgi:hypothetical protein